MAELWPPPTTVLSFIDLPYYQREQIYLYLLPHKPPEPHHLPEKQRVAHGKLLTARETEVDSCDERPNVPFDFDCRQIFNLHSTCRTVQADLLLIFRDYTFDVFVSHNQLSVASLTENDAVFDCFPFRTIPNLRIIVDNYVQGEPSTIYNIRARIVRLVNAVHAAYDGSEQKIESLQFKWVHDSNFAHDRSLFYARYRKGDVLWSVLEYWTFQGWHEWCVTTILEPLLMLYGMCQVGSTTIGLPWENPSSHNLDTLSNVHHWRIELICWLQGTDIAKCHHEALSINPFYHGLWSRLRSLADIVGRINLQTAFLRQMLLGAQHEAFDDLHRWWDFQNPVLRPRNPDELLASASRAVSGYNTRAHERNRQGYGLLRHPEWNDLQQPEFSTTARGVSNTVNALRTGGFMALWPCLAILVLHHPENYYSPIPKQLVSRAFAPKEDGMIHYNFLKAAKLSWHLRNCSSEWCNCSSGQGSSDVLRHYFES